MADETNEERRERIDLMLRLRECLRDDRIHVQDVNLSLVTAGAEQMGVRDLDELGIGYGSLPYNP